MATEIPQPGVEVLQEFRSASPTIAEPTLMPCIIGPAFEIIEVTKTDGTINSDALQGQYLQFPKTISQLSFPSPRDNIEECDVQEDTIRCFLYFGGVLNELLRSPGEGFLASWNRARRAGVLLGAPWTESGDDYILPLAGLTLVFSIDNPVPQTTADDLVVTFDATTSGTSNVTLAAAIAQINQSAGATVAYDYEDDGGQHFLLLMSPTWGAFSSITVKGGASANRVLYWDDTYYGTVNINTSFRCEGSGFRGMDDGDGDTLTPWIYFETGGFYSGLTVPFGNETQTYESGAEPLWMDEDGDYVGAQASALVFLGPTADIPLEVGDQFFADGVPVNNAEVLKIESTRFKMGTIDAILSTFDENGRAVNKVLNPTEVNTFYSSNPFAPRYGYFMAQNLLMSTTNKAAAIVGRVMGTDSTAGSAVSEGSYPVNGAYPLAGLTLRATVTEDGVEGVEQTFTFPAGYNDQTGHAVLLEAVAEAITLDGLVAEVVAGSPAILRSDALPASPTGLTGEVLTLELETNYYGATPTWGTELKITFASSPATWEDVVAAMNDWDAHVAPGDTPLFPYAKAFLVEEDGDSFIEIRTNAAHEDVALRVTAVGTDLASATGWGALTTSDHFHGTSKLSLKTTKRGADQSVSIAANGSANALLGFSTTVATTGTGTDVEFSAQPAQLIASDTLDYTAFAPGNQVSFTVSTNHGITSTLYTFTVPNPAPTSMDGLLSALNDTANWSPGTARPFAFFEAEDNFAQLRVKTYNTVGGVDRTGVQYILTCTSDAGPYLNFEEDDTDQGSNGLTGTTLTFRMNGSGALYEVTFSTDSLDDAVDLIADETGYRIAVPASEVLPQVTGVDEDQAHRHLALLSTLDGVASVIQVVCDESLLPDDAEITAVERAVLALGFYYLSGSSWVSQSSSSGDDFARAGYGRPDPDLSIDAFGNLVLNAEILRDPLSGAPFYPGLAAIYIQYKALRLDVTASASNPARLVVDDTAELEDVLSPINTGNPLALGMYFASINAPGIRVSGIGVDEVTAAAPEGTPLAYTKAFEFLESQKVYALAPLTHDTTVHQIGKTHAVTMSMPANRGERIIFVNPDFPIRENDTNLVSGESASKFAGADDTLVLDVSPVAAISAIGINTNEPIDEEEELYVEVEVVISGTSSIRNYILSAVNGMVASLNSSPSDDINGDGFYSIVPLTEPIINANWSIRKRGASLYVPGSSPPILDKNRIAETVNGAAASYGSRRFFYVFPDEATGSPTGTEMTLPAYYVCAAVAGMVGQLPPQQGFTNYPITGFTGVPKTGLFTNQQLNIIAGGGVFILYQPSEGAAVSCRHQLSTDSSSIETRELSITKCVDFGAILLRDTLRAYIGIYNVTQPFLDQLNTVVQGLLGFMVQAGIWIGAELNNVIQDSTSPDTVLIDITVDPPYPCNYIRVTLVV